MSIYALDDYREIIQKVSKQRGLTYRHLSEHCQIHPSYFSRVMRGKADFSPEQSYLIGRCLHLEGDDLEYLLVLVEAQSSGQHEHADYCWQKIRHLQDTRSRTLGRLQETEELSQADRSVYYEEALTAVVHMYLTIERYRLHPEKIGDQLGIPHSHIHEEIDKLVAMGLVNWQGKNLQLSAKRIHLDAASPLSRRNHVNWRLQAIEALAPYRQKDSDYHLSAVFSSNQEGKRRIREMFKEFISHAQQAASDTGRGDAVFALSFDLYDVGAKV